jgi:hypothetical protein
MKKSKTIQYKKFDVEIEVILNAVQPPPPAYHDTVAKHFINARVPEFGWIDHREVSDLHLNAEIGKAEEAAKNFIDEKTKDVPVEVVAKTNDHIDNLTSKGFK